MIPVLTIFKHEHVTPKFSTVFKVDVVLGDDPEPAPGDLSPQGKNVRVERVQIANWSIGPRGGWQGAATIGLPIAKWMIINAIIVELNQGLDLGIYEACWERLVPRMTYELVLHCIACGEPITGEEVLHHSVTQQHLDGLKSMGT